MTVDTLNSAFHAHSDKLEARGMSQVYWVSVNAVPGFSLDELADRAKRPNGKIRTTTVAAIEAAGFVIQETPGRRDRDGHCDVWLRSGDQVPPSRVDLERLCAAFAPAQANPWRRSDRGVTG